MVRKYLTRAEVLALTKLGPTWLRELRKRNEFPIPIRLSNSPTGRLRWLESEVIDWLESHREVV